jgi:hypothetical protein
MERKTDSPKLNLAAGEIIEVRSLEEILATLDERGCLDNMPFMPEMLQYCGKRLRVSKRAHKTCDNILPWNMRKVKNAVHLSEVRCDGQAHGNCDAGCLIFWHEAWLKRVATEFLAESEIRAAGSAVLGPESHSNPSTASQLPQILQRACQKAPDPVTGETVYSCQATQLREYTSNLPWWNLWQYVEDIRSGNMNRGLADSKSEKAFEYLLGSLDIIRTLLIEVFNKLQFIRKGVKYPRVEKSDAINPGPDLNLQPGEFVRVRSKQEIFGTLDRRDRNRGLLFDAEMLKYCGGTFRVLKRVIQIVDEKNGKILRMKSSCIILEGSACAGDYHQYCPRAIYHYWREGWLRRVE